MLPSLSQLSCGEHHSAPVGALPTTECNLCMDDENPINMLDTNTFVVACNGTPYAHVFHRHCLRQNIQTGSANAHFCPDCRGPLREAVYEELGMLSPHKAALATAATNLATARDRDTAREREFLAAGGLITEPPRPTHDGNRRYDEERPVYHTLDRRSPFDEERPRYTSLAANPSPYYEEELPRWRGGS